MTQSDDTRKLGSRKITEMTMREHFAISCFAALLSNAANDTCENHVEGAREAVKAADALLAELARESSADGE